MVDAQALVAHPSAPARGDHEQETVIDEPLEGEPCLRDSQAIIMDTVVISVQIASRGPWRL